MTENEDFQEALDRIARTPDGRALYLYLQKALCSISLDPHRGALRRHEGRRMFAAELMGLMAKGIRESDRTCITFAVSGAKPVSRSRGAGRRIDANTYVAGWDDNLGFTPGASAEPSTDSSEPA